MEWSKELQATYAHQQEIRAYLMECANIVMKKK